MTDTHTPQFMTGRVTARWLDDGRTMELIEPVVFRDSRGGVWTAPAGSKVDGASIPRFFWRLIGAPLTGRYRRASVVHDVYCNNRTQPHMSVHAMFHEAMRVDGVSRFKAWIIYQAVARCGPKW